MSEPVPTPRTDEESFYNAHADDGECVSASFARELERELAAVKRELEEIHKDLAGESI